MSRLKTPSPQRPSLTEVTGTDIEVKKLKIWVRGRGGIKGEGLFPPPFYQTLLFDRSLTFDTQNFDDDHIYPQDMTIDDRGRYTV